MGKLYMFFVLIAFSRDNTIQINYHIRVQYISRCRFTLSKVPCRYGFGNEFCILFKDLITKVKEVIGKRIIQSVLI